MVSTLRPRTGRCPARGRVVGGRRSAEVRRTGLLRGLLGLGATLVALGVEALGGSLRVGPTTIGGFEVRATLPAD